MSLVISIMLAIVEFALAYIYMVLIQGALCRVSRQNLTRRRSRVFCFWSNVAFLFKVVSPIFLLITSVFLFWVLCSTNGEADQVLIAFLTIFLLVVASMWLSAGVSSVMRFLELDYGCKKISKAWWGIMISSWLIAFPLSQMSIAPFLGGHAHMHQHNWMNILRFGYDENCLICFMDQAVRSLEKKRLISKKADALKAILPHLQRIVDDFNIGFMAILPEWEREIEDSELPLYMHQQGWNRRCVALLNNTIARNPELHVLCKGVNVEWISEKIDLPIFHEWFGYIHKEITRSQSFQNVPNPKGKATRDRQKPRLARIAEPRHRFGYEGVDRDDSALFERKFVWFDVCGTTNVFTLTLPRNADRLVETDAGCDYVRPIEILVAEYPQKPFLRLWASGYPVSNWPSPEELPYARRVGSFSDGDDELTVYAVSREEVVGKPMSHENDMEFDGVLLYARKIPDATSPRMRVTDMVARKSIPNGASLERELDALRRYWTSCPGSRVIGNLFNERVTPEIKRQNLLVWEDRRKGVFAHWGKSDAGGFVLYMVLTDKWGYKGGVNFREHKDYGSLCIAEESADL